MEDDNGAWHEDEELFSGMLTNFYTQLFTFSNPFDFERILDGVQAMVNDDMRDNLARPYTTDEVDAAIKKTTPLKAPSPDGMSPLFYQTY